MKHDHRWKPNTGLGISDTYQGLKSSKNFDEVVDLSEDYFEISVGIRKPTSEEKQESREIVSSRIFGGERESTQADKVRLAKYPLDLPGEDKYNFFSGIEYVIFQLLAEETGRVDGPYLPMLRSEIYKSRNDFEDGNFEFCLLRQSAFFETYCRLKLGRSRKTEWDDLNLGEVNTFAGGEIDRLKDLRESRNDYAHDWRKYINPTGEKQQLRETCITGLSLLSKLHRRELIKSYNLNCSKPISQRYAAEWEDRYMMEIHGSANPSIIAYETCDNCGHKFVPEDEGWKRCPNCDFPHDFLSRYE